MSDPQLDLLFDALAEQGLPRPDDEEITAALDLARVVARGVIRKGAPLACYAAGLAIGAAADPAERAARLRALVAHAERIAADRGADEDG
jgi:hypothetical protein